MKTPKEILDKYCGLALSMLSKETEFQNRILNAMKEYAENACKEQRKDCANKVVGIWTESELVDRVLECELTDLK